MSQTNIGDDEVDIVIGALHADLTSFLNEWRPLFSRFHLIIVKDPDLREGLKIPEGFNLHVYTKSDIDRVVGSSYTAINFSGYSCRYFGYLMSRKKYIFSVDDDCIPAKDDKGLSVDAVDQHITNLATPATLSSLTHSDHDAPTQALKPGHRNSRYVDAVLTVPARALMPVSGVNIAFNRELAGPALFPGLRLAAEGKLRWETVEDIWCGLCVKVRQCHRKLEERVGRREADGGSRPVLSVCEVSQAAVTTEDCVLEIVALVKERLATLDPVFARAAQAMADWIKLWKAVGSGSGSSRPSNG
ncbi:putative UDP-arabinopyranose mutase 5 [Vitis vinifera]|uniref:Putative UDP-arabinopyranose mutase 5 n=1 Tax=Vitis vinifera TaxID=29760 RepID=A0A438EDC8_VITVI|nr:putative UDP-arabinopyranose mutase 5 [Vitis vinifera]